MGWWLWKSIVSLVDVYLWFQKNSYDLFGGIDDYTIDHLRNSSIARQQTSVAESCVCTGFEEGGTQDNQRAPKFNEDDEMFA